MTVKVENKVALYLLSFIMVFSVISGSIATSVVRANGVTFKEVFDNEPEATKVTGGDWIIEGTNNGTAEIAIDPTTVNSNNKSLKLTDTNYVTGNEYLPSATATRTFSSQTGIFTVETKIRVEQLETVNQNFNIVLYDNSSNVAVKLFYAGGLWKYLPAAGTPEIALPSADFLGEWVTIRMRFNISEHKYDLTVISDAYNGIFADGTFNVKGLDIPAGISNVSKVRYFPQNYKGEYYIDYIALNSAAPAWTNGSLTVSDQTATSAKLTWSGASDDSGSIAKYNIYDGTTLINTAAGTANTKTLSNLSLGKHAFRIEAEDALGNQSSGGPTATMENKRSTFSDTFDFEPTAAKTNGSGWLVDTAYGTVEIVGDSTDYYLGNKSMKITDTDQVSGQEYRVGGAATRTFSPQTGKFTFETKVRIQQLETANQHFNIVFQNNSSAVVLKLVYSGNGWSYYTVPNPTANDISYMPAAIFLGEWVTVKVTFDMHLRKYDMTVTSDAFKTSTSTDTRLNKSTGVFTVTGQDIQTGISEVSKVNYFPQNYKGAYSIDYLTLADVRPTAMFPAPPSEHPRLYFRAKDIPALNAKMAGMGAYWVTVTNLSTQSGDGHLPARPAASNNNFNESILNIIRAKALVSVLGDNETLGREAINMLKNFLTDLSFKENNSTNVVVTSTVLAGGAMVYDWCYKYLTQAEKTDFVAKFENLAVNYTTLSFPPQPGTAITGHRSGSTILRDFLSAGLAIYDEKQDMYKVTAKLVMDDFAPARDVLYQSGMPYQGDSYGQLRYGYETTANLIFAGMGYPDAFDKNLGDVPYRILYTRRPDNDQLRDGDAYLIPNRGGHTYLPSTFLNSAGFYKNGYFKNEFLREYAEDQYLVDPILVPLFFDPDLPSKPLSELPLSRYFGSPVGSMVARTGWNLAANSSDVVAEMKVSEYHFNNHNQLDTGAFQLYYKGMLALDSGAYYEYDDNHDKNYFKRTIAHNSMLIYKQNDTFTRWGAPVSNDGGVKSPNKGVEATNINEVLTKGFKMSEIGGHQFGPDPMSMTPDYTYLKGNLTNAYLDRVDKYTRSFVFLNLKNSTHPAAMIVYDRVISKDPDYKKYWLLHSEQEPNVSGNVTTITRNLTSYSSYNGKLVNTTLQPSSTNLTIEKVGGPGQEFSVFGTNYPLTLPLPRKTGLDAGAWRVQISPTNKHTEDNFLNVIQVMDNNGGPAPLAVTRIDAGVMEGAKIADRVVMFSKSGDRLKGSITLPDIGTETTNFKYVVTDVAAGHWKVQKVSQSTWTPITVSEEGGALSFNGPAEQHTLTWSAVPF